MHYLTVTEGKLLKVATKEGPRDLPFPIDLSTGLTPAEIEAFLKVWTLCAPAHPALAPPPVVEAKPAATPSPTPAPSPASVPVAVPVNVVDADVTDKTIMPYPAMTREPPKDADAKARGSFLASISKRTELTWGYIQKVRGGLVKAGKEGSRKEPMMKALKLTGEADNGPRWMAIKDVWMTCGFAKAEGVKRATVYTATWSWDSVRTFARKRGTITPLSLAREFWLTEAECREQLEKHAPSWLNRHARKEEWSFSHDGPDAREADGVGENELRPLASGGRNGTPEGNGNGPQGRSESAQLQGEQGAGGADDGAQVEPEWLQAFNGPWPERVWVVTSEQKFRKGRISLNPANEANEKRGWVATPPSKVCYDTLERARASAFRETARTKFTNLAIELDVSKLREKGFRIGKADAFPVPSDKEKGSDVLMLLAPEKWQAIALHEFGAAQVVEKPQMARA